LLAFFVDRELLSVVVVEQGTADPYEREKQHDER